MNDKDSKIKFIIFFEKDEVDRKIEQIKTLKKILDRPLFEIKEIVESGKTELTFFREDYENVTKELDKAGIFYQVVKVTEEEETEDIQNKKVKNSQEINFIVSRDILKKKKNEVVECIVISREEYNELLKCKEMARDLIGSLRPITKNLSALTKDFSIALHNHIS